MADLAAEGDIDEHLVEGCVTCRCSTCQPSVLLLVLHVLLVPLKATSKLAAVEDPTAVEDPPAVEDPSAVEHPAAVVEHPSAVVEPTAVAAFELEVDHPSQIVVVARWPGA